MDIALCSLLTTASQSCGSSRTSLSADLAKNMGDSGEGPFNRPLNTFLRSYVPLIPFLFVS